MEIYTKRYCRVSFEPPDENSTSIIHRAIETIEGQLKLDSTEVCYGAPPSVVFESDSLQAVTRAGEMLEKALMVLGYTVT